MVARYSLYLEGWARSLGPAGRDEIAIPFITDIDRKISDLQGRTKLLESALRETVQRLLEANRRVVLVYPIPEVGYNAPRTLAKMTIDFDSPENFAKPFRDYENRQRDVFKILDNLGKSQNSIHIYTHTRLCDEFKCIVYVDGKPIYYDDDHLSLAGADYIAPLFDPVFDPELPAAPAPGIGGQ